MISSGEKVDKITCAVLGPTPETEIKFLNKWRSLSSKNPYRVWESSFTERCVTNLQSSPSIAEKVCNEIFIL